MAQTSYVVQGFEANALGMLRRLRPQDAPSKAIALRRAEALASGGGAVVVERAQGLEVDEYADPIVVARFGQVPREFGESA